MPTHNEHENEGHVPEHEEREPREASSIDASKGYEQTDVRIAGILVFLTALGIFVAVIGVVTFWLGGYFNGYIAKEDGPVSKWVKTADVRPLGNMASSPEMQKKLSELTNGFPGPKVQTDDGLQDMIDLHQREDLLLDHYSWANQAQGKVRIPIDRAMELIAARGLPVAAKVDHAPLMTGDADPVVLAPLTNGFVRTGFEQEQAAAVRLRKLK
jgi:hypothetical protein